MEIFERKKCSYERYVVDLFVSRLVDCTITVLLVMDGYTRPRDVGNRTRDAVSCDHITSLQLPFALDLENILYDGLRSKDTRSSPFPIRCRKDATYTVSPIRPQQHVDIFPHKNGG